MIRVLSYVGILALAAPALAEDNKSAGAADMTKMGPLSRPVTKQDKKGVDELYKAMEDAWKKKDIEAAAANVDFPVVMLSDNSRGEVQHFNATREQWIGFMKPMMDMPHDGIKMSHKHQVHFLSDTLAVAIEDNSLSGKMKGKWKGMSVLTLKDGKWKFKEMAEAGWGDVKPPETASERTRTPATTLPPNPTPVPPTR
jgi:Domain of unknown function (DUF4440)